MSRAAGAPLSSDAGSALTLSSALTLPFQTFAAPSFDDKILEVVAVFGSMQMAVSRVIKLQHHRIAQVLATVLEVGGTWETFGEAGPAPETSPSMISILIEPRRLTLSQGRPALPPRPETPSHCLLDS